MNPKSYTPGATAWICLLSISFMIFFGATWIRTQCTNLNFSISQIREEKSGLVTQNRNLEIEQARLRSPERIRSIAENRLGLSIPKPENIIELTGIVHEKGP